MVTPAANTGEYRFMCVDHVVKHVSYGDGSQSHSREMLLSVLISADRAVGAEGGTIAYEYVKSERAPTPIEEMAA